MGWYDRIIFNTRERLTSSDMNLLQQRIGWWVAAQKHALVNHSQYSQMAQPGRDRLLYYSDSGNCAFADVYSGLLVVPSTTIIQVEAGIAGIVQPALGSDINDHEYVIAAHDGSISPSIPFTTNLQGVGVWRYVEMQAFDSLESSSSVDIWNALTKLFTSSVLGKVRRAKLQFRVREGVVGSLPVLDEAWTPIGAIYVPPGASSYAQCDFWDVRPLVSERTPFQFSRLPSEITDWNDGKGAAAWPQDVDCNYYTDAFDRATRGTALVSGHNYWAGGQLRNTAPAEGADFGGTGEAGGDAAAYYAFHAKNLAYGLAPASGQNLAIYAVFPQGLPRWARWTEVAGGRILCGTRGLLVTDVMPDCGSGATQNNHTGWRLISMPSAHHMSGTHPGVQVAYVSAYFNNGSFPGSSLCSCSLLSHNEYSGVALAAASAGPDATRKNIELLNRGVRFPNRAISVLIQVIGSVDFTPATTAGVQSLHIEVHTGTIACAAMWSDSSRILHTQLRRVTDNTYGAGNRIDLNETFEIPVLCDAATATDKQLSVAMRVVAATAGTTYTAQWTATPNYRIVGWRTK